MPRPLHPPPGALQRNGGRHGHRAYGGAAHDGGDDTYSKGLQKRSPAATACRSPRISVAERGRTRPKPARGVGGGGGGRGKHSRARLPQAPWWSDGGNTECIQTVAAGEGPALPAGERMPPSPPAPRRDEGAGRGLLSVSAHSYRRYNSATLPNGRMAATALAMPSQFAGLSRSLLGPGAQHRVYKWKNWARNLAFGNLYGQPLLSGSNLLNFKHLRQYYKSKCEFSRSESRESGQNCTRNAGSSRMAVCCLTHATCKKV